MELIQLAAEREVGYQAAHSKLAEVLEKVIKAELLRTGWALEKTHDLDRLLEAIEEQRSDLIPQIEPLCDVLAEVYFTDRYPGFDLEDPDWEALREQVNQVAALLGVVAGRVGVSKS